MASNAKNLMSGRTTLVALLFLMVAVMAGCFMLVRRAEAQVPAAVVNPIEFAPNELWTPGMSFFNYFDSRSTRELKVKCLLPAVKNATVPFKIVASTPHGDVTYDIPIAGRTFGIYTITLSQRDVMILTLDDFLHGGYVEMRLPNLVFQEVSISISPATLANGKQVAPISADVEISGVSYDGEMDKAIQFPFVETQLPYSK